MGHAFNIRLDDPSVHAYAQRFCFLNGPDPALNRRLRRAVLEHKLELTEEADAERIQLLDVASQRALNAQLTASLRVPPELGISEDTRRAWIKNLGWKVARVPREARSVLVLGSATCREAVFLRHHLPDARIVCTDFVDQRIPGIERALGIEFHAGDFHALLAANPVAFDVVFSNHVLEHLFDPGKTLAHLRAALAPGGCMVAALPLDGQPGTPFSAALNASELHPLDMCTVDVGHAWKTNVSELLRALRAAGFEASEFSGRDGVFSVADREFGDRRAFERHARLGLWLNRALFASVRGALKRIFPSEVPALALKVVFGVEHRVWFGSNRLKNDFSIECLVVAK
jgi:SAM-dependent methyltransferase